MVDRRGDGAEGQGIEVQHQLVAHRLPDRPPARGLHRCRHVPPFVPLDTMTRLAPKVSRELQGFCSHDANCVRPLHVRLGHPGAARGGRRVHVSPKAFDLLRLLLERRPNVVSKTELHDRSGRARSSATPTSASWSPRSARCSATTRRTAGTSAPCTGSATRSAGRVSEGAVEPAGVAGYRCWLVWNDQTLPLTDGDNVLGRDPRSHRARRGLRRVAAPRADRRRRRQRRPSRISAAATARSCRDARSPRARARRRRHDRAGRSDADVPGVVGRSGGEDGEDRETEASGSRVQGSRCRVQGSAIGCVRIRDRRALPDGRRT